MCRGRDAAKDYRREEEAKVVLQAVSRSKRFDVTCVHVMIKVNCAPKGAFWRDGFVARSIADGCSWRSRPYSGFSRTAKIFPRISPRAKFWKPSTISCVGSTDALILALMDLDVKHAVQKRMSKEVLD